MSNKIPLLFILQIVCYILSNIHCVILWQISEQSHYNKYCVFHTSYGAHQTLCIKRFYFFLYFRICDILFIFDSHNEIWIIDFVLCAHLDIYAHVFLTEIFEFFCVAGAVWTIITLI